MHIQPSQPQDNQAIIVIVLITASLCVAYWRVALRMIVIIFIALAVLGVIAGLHSLHIAS
jgi:hypothetical protein